MQIWLQVALIRNVCFWWLLCVVPHPLCHLSVASPSDQSSPNLTIPVCSY